MPNEVLADIFMQLPPPDLGRLGLVCHLFRDVSGEFSPSLSLSRARAPPHA
jgi:hypothetical protein